MLEYDDARGYFEDWVADVAPDTVAATFDADGVGVSCDAMRQFRIE